MIVIHLAGSCTSTSLISDTTHNNSVDLYLIENFKCFMYATLKLNRLSLQNKGIVHDKNYLCLACFIHHLLRRINLTLNSAYQSQYNHTSPYSAPIIFIFSDTTLGPRNFSADHWPGVMSFDPNLMISWTEFFGDCQGVGPSTIIWDTWWCSLFLGLRGGIVVFGDRVDRCRDSTCSSPSTDWWSR